MNRNLLNQIERVVLLFVLYALAGVTGSSVAYRLLRLGRTGPDYGPLVLSVGLLVALVGCIVLVRGRENAPLFPLPPWVPGPGTTLVVLGLLPVIVSLFRPGATGTGAPATATRPRDTIVSVLPAPASSATLLSDTARAPLDGAPTVAATTESPSARIPAAAGQMIPRPRTSFSPYDGEAGLSGIYGASSRLEPTPRYASPSAPAGSDLAWAERLRRRVLRDNYAPSTAEMNRYRQVRDSLQRTSGNLSLGATGGALAAPAPATKTPKVDPFEEVPSDVPAGAPVRGSFGSGADTTAP